MSGSRCRTKPPSVKCERRRCVRNRYLTWDYGREFTHMRSTSWLHRPLGFLARLYLIVPLAGCTESSGAGPDLLRQERYQLLYANNNTLPVVLIDGIGDDRTELDSATLVPYAVGRTIDRRLVNDRTGRGGTGGNTRDTTVVRGQFMDIRVLRHVTPSLGTITYQRDSTIVDVEIRDQGCLCYS